METIILNFMHPLKPSILAELAPAREIRASLQLDLDSEEPTPMQVHRALDEIAETVEKAGGKLDGSMPVAIAMHGLVEATALILAELTGRLGVMPRILLFRRSSNGGFDLVRTGSITRKCGKCNGTGTFTGLGKPRRCRFCDGTGVLKSAPIGAVVDLESIRRAARGRR